MAKSRKKNPASGNPLLDLLITGGAFVALYLWLQNNCASASPINTSLCSTLFGTSTASSTSTVETSCLSAFSSAVLAAAGGNQTLANSAMDALTAAELTTIQASCAAGTVPAIPSTAQAVITAGLPASGSGSSSGSSSSSSSGGTSLAIPSNLTVTPTINSALQGTVNVNGDPVSLAVITGNLGNSSGVVFNSAGTDVTSLFTQAQIQQLVNAFLLAPQTSSGVTGLGYRGIPVRYLHSAY